MTDHTKVLTPGQRRPDVPPNPRSGPDPARSIRVASVTAGIGILLLAAFAGFGNFVVLEGLVTDGDAARTAQDILASEGMFRAGIAGLYLVVVLDVVVAWALLRVFSPVSSGLSRLAAWFRLAYAGVFAVAVSQLAGVPDLLQDPGYSAAFSTEQLQAQALLKVDAFNEIWSAALILFGAHLLLLGCLALRSGYVPRFLGILIVIAGAGYVFDSFTSLLSSNSGVTVSTVTFLGEFLLALWLVFRGSRLTMGADGHGI